MSGHGFMLGLIALAMLGCPAARADEYNYRNVLVGERAVGMGGAATAVADDAAAAYYNPAGLVQNSSTTLSLSATLLQLRNQTIGNFLSEDGVSQISAAIIAASSVYATDLLEGRFAFSILVPDSYDFEMNEQIVLDLPMPDDSRLVKAHLIRRKRYETYVLGPSMAWSLGSGWSLGFSLFVFYRNFDYYQDDTYLYSTGAMTQIIDNDSGSSIGMQGHAGVLYQPLDCLRIGLLGSVGGAFSDTGKGRRLRIESSGDDPESFTRVVTGGEFGGEGEDKVESKAPISFSLGIAWQIDPDWLVSLDGSFYLPLSYDRLGRQIDKRFTWNIAAGAEVRLWDAWPLRFGFFTNLSSAPPIDEEAIATVDPATYTLDELPPDKVDYYGLSVSFGQIGRNSTWDVALQAMLGSGERVEVLETGAAVHPVVDFSIGVTISGSYILYNGEEEKEAAAERPRLAGAEGVDEKERTD
ncbi:MAG: hypothetical protein JXR96_05080 [Deltaproteobacteria bacterium]|nr:hypothetical protein [Deltaproteobacteria bacterium]